MLRNVHAAAFGVAKSRAIGEHARDKDLTGGLTMRRLLCIFAILILMSTAVFNAAAAGSAEESDTVISYNTPENWANWGSVLEAFEEESGLNAPSDPKNSGQTLAALEAERDAPQADVAYFGIVFGIEAAAEGLMAPFEPENFDEIPAELKDPEGQWFTIHEGSIAFLVNTDELGDTPVPSSWEDLLDPQYEGMIGFLDPTQAAVGYSVITAANFAMGGSLDDWDPGIEYFRQLMENDVSLPAQTATSMVQQGEIPILIDADFNGYQVRYRDDAPVEVVIPEDGSLSIPYVIGLVEGGPNPELGQEFLNFTLSDQGQRLFSESYLRPVRDVEIDPEIEDRLLPDSAYESVVRPDFDEMLEVQEMVLDRWNSEVVD